MFELRKLSCVAIGLHFVSLAFGAAPRVSTVPANALHRSQAHVTYSSRNITLKGTSSAQGSHIKATWDFGDGTQPVSFPVERGHDVGTTHAYFGLPGTEFTATLTVEDTTTGESSTASYPLVLREKSLAVEYAVAVDEALWYLHKAMRSDPANVTSWNLLAFESQGFLASGDTSNPYTETVAGALTHLMAAPAANRDDAFFEAMARSGSPDAGALLSRAGGSAAAARKRLGFSGKQDLPSRLRALSAAGTGRPDPQWIRLEAQLRDQNHFDLPVSSLYELTQALRLHSTNGEPAPLLAIESETLGAIDWFSAEASKGASTDGIARVLLNRQRPDGSFPDEPDSTAKTIIMAAPLADHSVTNVTSQLTITTSPFVFNRASSTYRTNLTITNNTGLTIAGPFTAGILNLVSGATFVNGNGTFNGWPFISIPGAASLAPGGSAVVQLQFTTLPGVTITFNKVIYAGTFPPSPLAVACPAPAGTQGSPYSSSLVGSGGSLAYTYSIGPGSLPSPLILNPATGAITGTPGATGTFPFTANVTDSAATIPQTASTPCSIVVGTAAQPDLTIAKSHSGDFTNASTGNTYTVVVTNSGSGNKDAGQSVSVTDIPPSGLTVTGMAGAGWTCTTLPTCTRADVLAASASYPPITVTVSVTAGATSPQVNSVTVTTAQAESNSGNNNATDSTTIVRPDLTISKSHTGNFTQGGTGTYTVTVTNSGLGTKLSGQAVSVTDAPPTGLTVTGMSGTGWTCITLPTCTRNDVLAPGASYPPITVTVDVAANATSPQVNSISVTTAQLESNSGNNTSNDSTTIDVAGQPDLTIVKSHTGDFTNASTGNTYTVVVTNSGSGSKNAGQSVSVTDTPPSGLTVTGMAGAGWTCITLPTCTRADVLAASASYPPITVTVSVTASATSPQVNSVTVTTAQAESNTGNNTATDPTTIVRPDLTITKSHTGSFTQGSTGNTYTVVVTNSGAGAKLAGQAVSVTDAPPTGLTVTGMAGSGWTCTTLPTCTRNDVLAPAASYAPITVTVSVASTATNPRVNSISVTTAQLESNSGNNTATDSTTIVQPDLTITKSHTGNFLQGSTGNTYTVLVTNSGLGDKLAGQSVSVTDAPPAGLTVTAMGGTGWTCTTIPTCTRSDVLASAASYPALTVTVSVASNATTPQVNSITVTTAQSETNGGNNTASDSTIIEGPPQITSGNAVTFRPGLTGQSFTVTTTGLPSGAAMDITQTGTLPVGVVFTDNNNGTATLNGTPAAGTQGVVGTPPSQAYPLVITANNGIAPNAVQNPFTLTIACPTITVSGTTPLNLTFGVAMSATTYTQSGGSGAIVWSATGLPTNLSINSSSGQLSGTPNVTGTFNATISATDAGGCIGTRAVTIAVAPVAVNDTYSNLVDNTQFAVTGGSTATPASPFVGSLTQVDGNDLPSGGVVVTAGTFATTQSGSVTIAADGTFLYTPPVRSALAAITTDSFNYTISSNTGGGAAIAAIGTVNLNLAGRVWYVRNNTAAGNGQSQSPFNTLASAVSASLANDTIYVYQGDGTTTNLGAAALKTGQKLIGQGVALVVNGNTLASAGSFPLLGGTVTLANSVTAQGFDMSTGTSTGISGTSVTGVTVTPRDVATTSGTAVNIGGSGNNGTYSLRKVSVNGATTGISITNFSGTFAVTANGGTCSNSTNCTGGAIQNTTNAVLLSAAANVSIDRMFIQNCSDSGVKGSNSSSNFAFTNGFINNVGTALAAQTSNIAFNTQTAGTEINLTGTVTITGNTLTNAYYHGVSIVNFGGTLSNVNISNNIVTSSTSTATSKGTGIQIFLAGSAGAVGTLTAATIHQNTVTNFPSDAGVMVQCNQATSEAAPATTCGWGGANLVAITNNTISGQSAATRIGTQGILFNVNGRGSGNFNVSSNNVSHTTGNSISHNVFGDAVVTSTISGNTVIANNTLGAAGIAGGTSFTTGFTSTPSLTVTITNNNVSQTDGNGILMVSRDNATGQLNISVKNNTVAAPLGGVRPGIRIDAGNASGDNDVCLDMSGNTSAGSGGSQGLGLRKQGTSTTVNAFGVEGMAATSTPGIETFISGLNPAGAGTLLISATSGFTSCSTAP